MTIQLPFSLKNKHFSAIAAFFFGLVVHFFALTTMLHNLDNIATPVGIGAGVTSGRWFLDLMGWGVAKFMVGSYNLHWFNGLVYLLILAAAAYFLVEVLEIRSRLFAVLTGMALISFPAAAEIILFRFTCIQYAVAMLFSIMAVWSMKKWKYGFVLSVLLSTCSLGIYQAFLPMTVSLFVLILLRQTLEGEEKVSRLFLRGVCYCCCIVAALVLYLLIVKVTTLPYANSLDTYQGMDQMGKMNLQDLPKLVVNAFVTFFTAPRHGYKIIQTTFMSLLYIGLGTAALGVMGYILIVRLRKLGNVLFAAFLCIVFPVAVNLVTIMSPDAGISTMMVYSYVLVMILPLLALDVLLPDENLAAFLRSAGKKGVCLLLGLLIFCNTYYTNMNYQIAYYHTQQTENYMNGLIVQVRMTEGYTPEKKWVFLGDIRDPLLDNFWMDIGEDLGYSRNYPVTYLVQFYSWESWISSYVGYSIPFAGDDEKTELRQTDAVKEMPVWPSQGSIKVIDDYVVIKLG